MGLYSGRLIIGGLFASEICNEGLIIWRACFWRGLLSEFYGKSVDSRRIKDAHIRQTIPECVFNIKNVWKLYRAAVHVKRSVMGK